VPPADPPAVRLRDLRVAWAPTFPGVPVASSIAAALGRFAAELDPLCAAVEETLPEVSFAEIAKVRVYLSRAVRLAFAPPSEEEPLPTLTEYFAALDRRDAITLACEEFFARWDALLCPVAMTTAFPHCPTDSPLDVDGESVNYWRVIGHCAPFNFTGHPAAVIPLGRDPQGLPIGIQVVSRRWGDERLLAIAERLAEVAPPFTPPPLEGSL
jgi:amidase